MVKLDNDSRHAAYDLYLRNGVFFPLVGAVLLGQQDGIVLADQAIAPHRVYVEHAFGFAQLFGETHADFDELLRDYLIVDRSFVAPKVRLYTPVEPDFLRGPGFNRERSKRQRFVLGSERNAPRCDQVPMVDHRIEIRVLQTPDVSIIDEHFRVVRRFWRTAEDFTTSAQAAVAWVDGQPAAICYAAAVADGQAEIDVLTRPEYRRIGLGKRVVHTFCEHCLNRGLKPLWDCFTNNAGSMALCKSCGFVPLRAPYPFYTLSK